MNSPILTGQMRRVQDGIACSVFDLPLISYVGGFTYGRMGSYGLVVHSASPTAAVQERQCVHESDELQSLLRGFRAWFRVTQSNAEDPFKSL